MTILSVSALSFRVGVKEILENISFAVEDGDRVGIVGVRKLCNACDSVMRKIVNLF